MGSQADAWVHGRHGAGQQTLIFCCRLPPTQLYDADTGAKIGNEVRVNNSATGADGTAAGGAYSFAVPYKQPQRLAVEITADAGATRSEPSERWPLETVGELRSTGE